MPERFAPTNPTGQKIEGGGDSPPRNRESAETGTTSFKGWVIQAEPMASHSDQKLMGGIYRRQAVA